MTGNTADSGKLTREASITIAAPLQSVWDELTRLDALQRFYFNSIVRGRLEPGAAFRYESHDGRYLFISGTTLEVDPPRRWVQQFQFGHLPDAPTRVTWTLSERSDGVEVRVFHEGFAGPTKTWRMTARGWPSILANLKAIIERGKLPLSTRLGYMVMQIVAPLAFKKGR